MSEAFWRYSLLAWGFVYFILAFAWRSLIVFRRTRVNPIVLSRSDDVHGYVGRGFTLVVAGCAVVVMLIAFGGRAPVWLGAFSALQSPVMFWIGWFLLVISLPWIFVAQSQMGASWRVGIDAQHRTELVQHGLFLISRNPIFLAMRINLLGLFLVFPAAATLALLIAGEILIQVQVRLEEQFLLQLHGQPYATYCSRVRRWL